MSAPGVCRATDGLVAMPVLLAILNSHTLGHTLQTEVCGQQSNCEASNSSLLNGKTGIERWAPQL